MRTKLSARCAVSLNRGNIKTKMCTGLRTQLPNSQTFTQGDLRLLEDGFNRLLEDGDFRLLE